MGYNPKKSTQVPHIRTKPFPHFLQYEQWQSDPPVKPAVKLFIQNFSVWTFKEKPQYYANFLWYKGLTKNQALKNMITKIALRVYTNIFACSNFFGIEPSIYSGTKIQHFQSPTHLLVLLYPVWKIQVTHNNNRDATWQGQKPNIALWFILCWMGTKYKTTFNLWMSWTQLNMQSIKEYPCTQNA